MSQHCEPSIGMPLCSYAVKIFSFRASISGPDHVIEAVRQAFPTAPAWPAALSDGVQLDLHVWQPDTTCESWRITENDMATHTCQSLAELQSLLVWLINSRAVEWIGKDHLLFHAGAVAVGQTGIILPAQSGSGKSTLTAALVADGCTYFSDEAAVIDPDSGLLLPFQKAIKLEPASLPVLASRFPDLEVHSVAQRRRVTYLCPPDDRWPSGPATPKLIVFPQYVNGAPTEMAPMPRSVAFERLLAHSFSAGNLAADGVKQLVRLVQGCACYELPFSDLDDAVKQIMLVVD
jgi:HprK-related kinase A